MTDTDQKLLIGVLDELLSSQLQLERESGNYNEKIDEAVSVYHKLPTQFLHLEPRGFE